MLTGKGKAAIGGTVVLDDPDRSLPRGDWVFGHASEEQTAVVELRAGEAMPISISSTGIKGFAAVHLGAQPVEPPPLIEEAVEAARAAEVAVVVVGTTDEWETEGVDRTTIALPGEQDELVRRVAAACPRTVVVVNAGGPVAMPWLDDVDAVVVASFAGEETGPAVAAVLAGDADPGGRLPVTYPRRLEDSPAWPHYRPVDGVQTYGEGRLVGYRGHDASGIEPLFPFGHGLSYGTSAWSGCRLSADRVEAGGTVTVSVDVANAGDRPVTDVVQVYVTHPDPGMPPKTLAGFAKVVVDPGASRTAEVVLGDVAWRRWDEAARRWVVDPGRREVLVAASAADVRARLALEVAG
jgi:beta-glucosidase